MNNVGQYLMGVRLLDVNGELDAALFDVTMYKNKKAVKIAY
tara:strand:- start:2158 stop:2280 length:123 start_codon:yes stop_codon:yes gene_type:complete